MAPEVKPVPVTVTVKSPPPLTAELGVIRLIIGGGIVTVKICGLEVPPPGTGFETTTLSWLVVATSAAVMATFTVELETKVVGRRLPLS